MKKLVIYGIVQGVGFRPTVYRVARMLHLNGWVKNNGSNVEIVIDGDTQEFLTKLKEHLPPNARIDHIEVEELETQQLSGFFILESTQGTKNFPPPPDYGLCPSCFRDFSTPGNRRYHYPFTNCTDCGARFTVIANLPFDRKNTTMNDFPMCEECTREYTQPENRRFHAQTISCPTCGPRYTLYDRTGKAVGSDNPFKEFARCIDEGYICVLKTYGGMHLICSLDRIPYFREWYKRKTKPFALMMRDIETVEKYAYVSEKERELLLSQCRPIVLLSKKIKDERIENAAPLLPNFGVMLPYAPVHYLIFHYLKSEGFVATSANPPGEPMMIENQRAFSLNADYYLLHNMKIYNRCDDSVVRLHENRKFFIRKSRGFVPEVILWDAEKSSIGVGAQENLSASLLHKGRIYTTQYIGDGENYEVIQYLRSAIKHYLKLFNVETVDYVCMDMHPMYTTRKIAMELANEYNVPCLEIQHHWAHAASLFVDNRRSGGVCITIDGTGYGTDGKVWGGEVLVADFSGFTRAGHLIEFPLIGGEQAVYDIRRIAFALGELTGNEIKLEDAGIMRALMRRGIPCTSFGRFLDALSYILGVCKERTYDGEPAMQLESLLMNGSAEVEMPENIVMEKNKEFVVDILPVVEKVFAKLGKEKREHIAYSAVNAVVKGMVEIAVRCGREYGWKEIGVSGGVSYNGPIVRMIESHAKNLGFEVMLHNNVPNGDMGISVGQCAIGGKKS
ncbi:MAG: carbamoyltransferase HypF [Thermoplasmata archaeon]